MSTSEGNDRCLNERRKLLQASVCAMLLELGIQNAQRSVIETLVEMVQSLIVELSRSSQSYSELCGRSALLFVDVYIAITELGLNIKSLYEFGKQKNRYVLPNPQIMPKQSPPKILQTGKKKQLYSYIPDHFPPFPDSHAYERTETYKQPVTEYEAIREKSSSQKRDLERALTHFMAKTNDSDSTHSLFPDEESSQVFPLIPLNSKLFTYLSALLPRDQIFDDEDDSKNIENEKKKNDNQVTNENDENKDNNRIKLNENDETNENYSKSENDNDVNDNPFLRPTKVCRRRGSNQIKLNK